jgi:alkanesulfonate monooxygenase SsuD/methylene tetrahydromethanopterin reductase-like flavin-dependent oxidoreductase (luciferase family)
VTIDRRSLLAYAGIATLIGAMPIAAREAEDAAAELPDYTLRITTGLVELSPEHIVSTALYNGQFPGPLIRLEEGKRFVVDDHNDTDLPELVHWHGQTIPSDVDGASEEGTPFIPPHGMRRIAFEVAIVGGPDTVAERIAALHHEFGFGNFMLVTGFLGNLPQEEVVRTLELFASEVRPRFRRMLKPVGGHPAADAQRITI